MIGRTIFLVLGTLILLFGGVVGFFGQDMHEAGTPIALVGVGFMLGAIALALETFDGKSSLRRGLSSGMIAIAGRSGCQWLR